MPQNDTPLTIGNLEEVSMPIYLVDPQVPGPIGPTDRSFAFLDSVHDLALIAGKAAWLITSPSITTYPDGHVPGTRPGDLWLDAVPVLDNPNDEGSWVPSVTKAGFDTGSYPYHPVNFRRKFAPGVDAGEDLITALINSDVDVFIYNRPGCEPYPYRDGPDKTLCYSPGRTAVGYYSLRDPARLTAVVVYCHYAGIECHGCPGVGPNDGCDESGRWAMDDTYHYSQDPSDHILFHELDHVLLAIRDRAAGITPTTESREEAVIGDVNIYRSQRGFPTRLLTEAQFWAAVHEGLLPNNIDSEICVTPVNPTRRAGVVGPQWRYSQKNPGTLTYLSPQGNEYELTFPAWSQQRGDLSFTETVNAAGPDFNFRVNIIQLSVNLARDSFVFPSAENFIQNTGPGGATMGHQDPAGPGTWWFYVYVADRIDRGPDYGGAILHAGLRYTSSFLNVYKLEPIVDEKKNVVYYGSTSIANIRDAIDAANWPAGRAVFDPLGDAVRTIKARVIAQELRDDAFVAPSDGTTWWDDGVSRSHSQRFTNLPPAWTNTFISNRPAPSANFNTAAAEPPPKPVDPVPSLFSGCLVAESHPAGRDAQVLNELRALRENFLRRSPWGRSLFDRFHKYYYSFSTAIANEIIRDEDMRDSIGFAVAVPIINYLRMIARVPRINDCEMATLSPLLRRFVESILTDMHEWLAGIDVGTRLGGLNCEEAAIEVAIALRFRFRSDETRAKYLAELESEGVLPLRGAAADLAQARSAMLALGSTAAEVARVISMT